MKTQTFEFESQAIRALADETGNPIFIAKDISDILGYQLPEKAIRILDEDEYFLSRIGISGQNRNMYVVTESGLYHLIFKSTKPNAQPFRKWVTSVVLPAIRKSGQFSTEEARNRELELQKLTNQIAVERKLESASRAETSKHKNKRLKLETQREQLITNYEQNKLKFPELEECLTTVEK